MFDFSPVEAGAVNTRLALGRQVTLECYDCNAEVLADPELMEQVFLHAANVSHATVVSSHFHSFQPQGISGVVIISESHFAVHAWPEHDYAAVDIFTCGDMIDFEAACVAIRDGLGSIHTIVSSIMNRGIVNNQGIERMVTVCENDANSYSLSWRNRYERMAAHGISCSIDLYNCTSGSGAALHGTTEKLAATLEKACGFTGMKESCSCEKNSQFDSSRYCFANGSLVAHITKDGQTAYIDIFAGTYFEPRIAAEMALAAFGGGHYRMQIAIRQ